MTKNEIAEKVVKDFTAANEKENGFNKAQAFSTAPDFNRPEASATPEYRKEYSFEYNGKKIASGWFNDGSARIFAQGLTVGFRQFRSTAKIEVYTMSPKRLEWVQG